MCATDIHQNRIDIIKDLKMGKNWTQLKKKLTSPPSPQINHFLTEYEIFFRKKNEALIIFEIQFGFIIE